VQALQRANPFSDDDARAIADLILAAQPLAAAAARPSPNAPSAAAREVAASVDDLSLWLRAMVTVRREVSESSEPSRPELAAAIDETMITVVTAVIDRLRDEGLTDPLTRIGNRRAMDRDLLAAAAAADRRHSRLALVVIDVDGLKVINDMLGHAEGDDYLIALTQALRSSVRIDDSLYRMGGDEFAILMPESDADAAGRVLSRAVDSGAPTFSAGIAVYPDEADNVHGVLRLADERLLAGRRARRASQASLEGGPARSGWTTTSNDRITSD
jgi:diguanylate cyclase (GGDEF)-like protein